MRVLMASIAALGGVFTMYEGGAMASDSADHLKAIIAKMMNCDYSTIVDANEELKRTKIDEAAGIMLLEAAAKAPDCSDLFFGHPSNYLIEAAGRNASPKYYPIILRDYPDYKQSGKSEAVRILLHAGTPEAYETLQTLMQQSCKRGDLQLTPGMSGDLSENQDAADLPFVECLISDLQQARKINFETALVALGHLHHNWISEERQRPLGPLLIARIDNLLKKASPLQQSAGEAWKWADNYLLVREDLALMLDLYGATQLPLDEKTLHEALALADPRMKYFAAAALLSRKFDVASNVLRDIAASAESRNELYEHLQKLGQEDLFPVEYKNQKSLAEGNFVRWLIYPTELGRVPDEIEFIETKPQGTDKLMYYFKFRTDPPHWSSADGWMLGWAGPFPKDGPLETHGTDTFSEFEKIN